MSKIKYYQIREKIFDNTALKFKGKKEAVKYCKANNIDESEIYLLSSNGELEYLNRLLLKQEDNEIYEIKSHEKVCLVGEFKNAKGDVLPNYMFETSFTYRDRGSNKPHIVKIVDSIYELNKKLILEKTLYDREHWLADCYLEVLVFNSGDKSFKEWKIGDSEIGIMHEQQLRKERLKQRQFIRQQEKFDRLLKLRDEGKITERQRQELYRLEKVYGGKEKNDNK